MKILYHRSFKNRWYLHESGENCGFRWRSVTASDKRYKNPGTQVTYQQYLFFVFVNKWLVSGVVESHITFYVTRCFHCRIRIFQQWKLKHMYVRGRRKGKHQNLRFFRSWWHGSIRLLASPWWTFEALVILHGIIGQLVQIYTTSSNDN